MKVSAILVLMLLSFAGFVHARIMPDGYLNDDESLTKNNHIRLFTSPEEIVCKCLVNVTDWVVAVKVLWGAVVRSGDNDVGRTPRQAPPSPREKFPSPAGHHAPPSVAILHSAGHHPHLAYAVRHRPPLSPVLGCILIDEENRGFAKILIRTFLPPLILMQPKNEAPESLNLAVPFASPPKLLLLHLACGLGLVSGFWVAFNFYSFSLVQNSAETLVVLWAVEASVVIPLYSLFRRNPEQCSYAKAIGRGLLSLPAGALVNAIGAIVLGAPVGIQHFRKTAHWSLLMSVLTFVPAAAVYGSSWADWHRIFAHTKPVGSTGFAICLPAHGAVIGAWFGAWPMPLDWERPWQEWPVCVTYGAILGYLVGMVVSSGFVVFHNKRHHGKED